MGIAYGEAAVVGHHDGVFRAHLLAHRATDARFGVDELRDPGELRSVERQTVKGTDVDAEVAARAQLLDDDRLRPVRPPLNTLGHFAHRIGDALDRAHVGARSAVNAHAGIDVMDRLLLSRDGFNGTYFYAGGTADACIQMVWAIGFLRQNVRRDIGT